MKEFEPNKGHGQFCQKCQAWRGSLGLEPTPELYIQHIVQVFKEIWRVLRKDGTVWLNLGDSYASQPASTGISFRRDRAVVVPRGRNLEGLKPKDLCGIPWRVALALQADGWWLRSDIIWSKKNPMPESVTDRPTRSHEYLFLLAKSQKYFYDNEAVREKGPQLGHYRKDGRSGSANSETTLTDEKMVNPGFREKFDNPAGRNLRSVWTIATQPFPDAHFATFPEKLVEPCIKAGTSEKGCCPECGAPWVRVVEKKGTATRPGKESKYVDENGNDMRGDNSGHLKQRVIVESKTIGWKPSCDCQMRGGGIPCTVLDPFGGSGRTAIVAKKLGRKCIIIELKGEYCEMPLKELSQENIF